jgi:steroid 5-alpha reductase family enzyme
MHPLAIAFAAGWLLAASIMVGIWLLQRVTRNAGWVDAAWAGSIAGLGILAAACLPGLGPRRWWVAAMAAAWGGRLALHIGLRTAATGREDSRYRHLREQWGDRAQLELFRFYQIQAFVAALFAMPIVIAQMNPHPFPRAWDLIGLAIFAIALCGEHLADRQLVRFKQSKDAQNRTCRSGLWRYSRHPNYFFEWLHWWSYPLLSIGTMLGWLTLLGPALMLYFLIKVTGIRISEERSLRSRPDYAEYVRTTSPFIPWPPKRGG